MLYFAYGSNLLQDRLRARCPSAQFYCVGRTDGEALDFSKVGSDGSGKATIKRVSQKESVLGAIYEIETGEIPSLDAAESGYNIENNYIVYDRDNLPIQTFTYRAQQELIDQNVKPFKWYMDLIIAGAVEKKFPKIYISNLKNVLSVNDPDSCRPERLKALEVLKNH